jgi:hypothetical protein
MGHEGHPGTHEGYRLSCEEFAQLVDRAGGKCERCGKAHLRLLIDHDHDHPFGRRAVRGLVCPGCNQILARPIKPDDDLSAPYLDRPFHALIPPVRPRRGWGTAAAMRALEVWSPCPQGAKHLGALVFIRPPREVKAAAKGALDERDVEMTAFLTACLIAVANEPDRLLALLQRHWPAPKPKGRPRKAS